MSERKTIPMWSGVFLVFPDALQEVARVSYVGSQQHNPGKPTHWDREKSTDQLDAALRHLIDHAKGNERDDDGMLHLAKVAWRVLAELQLELEKESVKVNVSYCKFCCGPCIWA